MSFFRGLPFAQVREDAEVELFVAGQRPIERGLIIASAGCTALALAPRGGHWTALDSNPAQLELCQLKARLLTNGNRDRILPLLRTGRVDRMLDGLACLYRYGLFRNARVREFFNLDDLAAQRQHFESYWDGRLWRGCFQLAIGQPLLFMRWFFGSLTHSFPPNLATHLRHEVEAALLRSPARQNPYLWQLFLGGYPPGVWPPYLGDLPRDLSGLEWVKGDLLEWLEEQPSDSLDFFGLSNVPELASGPEIARLGKALVRVGRPGALVVLRRIIPRSYRPDLGEGLVFADALSRRARELERGCFCRTIEVFEVQGQSSLSA